MKTQQPHARLSKWRKILFALVGLMTYSMAFSQLPTASQVAADMTIGWNLGNTLEAICSETAWGNPTTTQQLINSVKAAGFNTIRIPVSWDCHSSNGVIDAAWLARVKQVVDYSINQSMYVIINIHWDNGWLENNVTTSAQASVNAKQQNYWTQIANYFQAYDERVLFASANEPHVENATGMSVLMSYHQTFVNAVRATGGNNSSRTLIIQGPSTDIEKTNNLMNTMPTDQIANRLMVEVHYYTPYQFCLMTEDANWGNMFYFWGNGYHSTTNTSRNATWGEESDLNTYFAMMQTKFVNNGIPVILGEFGAIKRSNLTGADLSLHTASREYYHKYVVQSAKSHGMVPIYWDNGVAEFALFNRSTGAIVDQGNVNALMEGAGVIETTYTLTSSTIGSGTISLSPSGGAYPSGTVVTVTANPSSGWQFSGWSGSLSGSTNPTTFIMNSNKAITATFTNGSATTTHVQSIVTGTQSAGQGKKRGTATVTIHTNLENPVSGATVTGTFSGSFSGTASGVTNSNGTVTLVSSGTAKGNVIVNFCVTNVTHSSLAYASTQNDITCTGAGMRLAGEQGELARQGDLELYPNPAANGVFYINTFGKSEKVSVMIFDVQGKLVFSQVSTDSGLVEIQSNLSSGIYLVNIHAGAFKASRKLIVN